MTLKDEVKVLSHNKRKFFLLRIADLETALALQLTGVQKGTYNSWMQDSEFVALYRRRDEFNAEYKHEAIQLLRRDNQLEAVLLEGKILGKIREELETSTYNLVRTQLAREVYTKLIGDMDLTPKTPLMTWEQNILNMQSPPQIANKVKLESIDAEFKEVSQPEEQPGESPPVQESEQKPPEVLEEVEEVVG